MVASFLCIYFRDCMGLYNSLKRWMLNKWPHYIWTHQKLYQVYSACPSAESCGDAECRNQMQVALGQVYGLKAVPLYKLHLVAICNLLWLCSSFHQVAQVFNYTCGGHHPLQLSLVVFFLIALVHLLMCTQANITRMDQSG